LFLKHHKLSVSDSSTILAISSQLYQRTGNSWDLCPSRGCCLLGVSLLPGGFTHLWTLQW